MKVHILIRGGGQDVRLADKCPKDIAFRICIVKESSGDWRALMKLATTPGAPENCRPEASEEGNQPMQNGKRLNKELCR